METDLKRKKHRRQKRKRISAIEMGWRLRWARALCGLTLEKASGFVGCSKQNLSFIEHGKQEAPNAMIVCDLCVLYGITVDSLMVPSGMNEIEDEATATPKK